MNFFNMLTRVGSIVGALVLLVGISSANGAPQEAAAAGIAIAFGVLPYVIFRVLQISRDAEDRKTQHVAILARLDTLIEAQQNLR